ncbi:hypothetical protein M885DRAFT_623385, partial [Pelagophyceae sp. CCMP2097]
MRPRGRRRAGPRWRRTGSSPWSSWSRKGSCPATSTSPRVADARRRLEDQREREQWHERILRLVARGCVLTTSSATGKPFEVRLPGARQRQTAPICVLARQDGVAVKARRGKSEARRAPGSLCLVCTCKE